MRAERECPSRAGDGGGGAPACRRSSRVACSPAVFQACTLEGDEFQQPPKQEAGNGAQESGGGSDRGRFHAAQASTAMLRGAFSCVTSAQSRSVGFGVLRSVKPARGLADFVHSIAAAAVRRLLQSLVLL